MTTISADALPDALGAAAREFISQTHRLLIGSERPEAADGRTFATLDPATGREIAQVAQAGPADVERAVAAAREAFEEGPWASMPAALKSMQRRTAPSVERSTFGQFQPVISN